MTKEKTKLTPTEKKFFEQHVVETVVGTLAQVLNDQPQEYMQAMLATTRAILTNSVQEGNLDEVVTKAGLALLQKVPFKTIQKVDKFMRSEDYQAVMVGAATVVQTDMREEFMDLTAAAAHMAEGLLKEVKEQAAKDFAAAA